MNTAKLIGGGASRPSWPDTTSGTITGAVNVGGEKEVYKDTILPNLRFRTLKQGSYITLTQNANDITIDGTAPGEVNTASNLGGEKEVFKSKVAADLQFRTLKQGSYITLTQNANDITIDGTAPGEVNTASNLGAGSGLYASKVGVDLRFKSLVAGTNITLTPGANDITIDAAGGGGGDYYQTDFIRAIDIISSQYNNGIALQSAISELTTGGTDATQAVYTTAAATPTKGTLQLLYVGTYGTFSTPTVSGAGLTWILIDKVHSHQSNAESLYIFRALGYSAVNGALTITFGVNQNRAAWGWYEFTNLSTSGDNGQGAIAKYAKDNGASDGINNLEIVGGSPGCKNPQMFAVFLGKNNPVIDSNYTSQTVSSAGNNWDQIRGRAAFLAGFDYDCLSNPNDSSWEMGFLFQLDNPTPFFNNSINLTPGSNAGYITSAKIYKPSILSFEWAIPYAWDGSAIQARAFFFTENDVTHGNTGYVNVDFVLQKNYDSAKAGGGGGSSYWTWTDSTTKQVEKMLLNAAVTPGNSIGDVAAAGDCVRVDITRASGGSDTITGAVNLLGIQIRTKCAVF